MPNRDRQPSLAVATLASPRGSRTAVWLLVLGAILALGSTAGALAPKALAYDLPDLPDLPQAPVPYLLGGQATVVFQVHPNFHSPYQGTNSFTPQAENAISQSYTLYTGVRLLPWLELYGDPEMVRGRGLSDALGIAGFTNGEVIRNPAIGTAPYLARVFLRANIPLAEGSEDVPTGELQVEGTRPTHRLTVTFGVLATNDLFDTNRYANSARTQFLNWALITDPAYDFAADTRGYTRGLALEWAIPDFALKAGVFQMPTVANGVDLDWDLGKANGAQIEADLRHEIWEGHATVLRLFSYLNHANMGDYRLAVAQAQASGTTPDIAATRVPGRAKYGFGLNFEQPLADAGETGLFGRLGWNDGATESFAFTECEASLSVGAQVAGATWRREDDRVGIAFVANGLDDRHAEYLGAGGLGFLLGDGRLNHGSEMITEVYYALHLLSWFTVSADYQFVEHPGYNRDRGPVSVFSLRGHIEGLTSVL